MEPVPEVDYTATSSRPQWADLPDGVREAVARAAGASVLRAEPSVTSGFTGGFAAVLHLGTGRRVFAKAGSDANPHLLGAYRREALVLAALPRAVPAPSLVGEASLRPGEADAAAWQVVVSEVVEGRLPQPWTDPALEAVHAACLATVEALDPPPPALAPVLSRLAHDYAEDSSIRRVFRDLDAGRMPLTWGQPGWVPRHYAELDALVALAPVALAGTAGTHGDLRADNILVAGRRAVLVDWNWLSVGPRWTDVVGLLPPARADGLDADRWVRTSPLTRDVEPDHLDCWLAVIAAYMLANADRPLFPGGAPVLRVHQRRYARTFLDWLGHRRGWTS